MVDKDERALLYYALFILCGISSHVIHNVSKLGAETLERIQPGSAPAASIEYGE